MTEAHLNRLLTFLGDMPLAIRHPPLNPETAAEQRETLASGVLEVKRAFKDLWDERDDADRRAGAAARKIHQLQRQLDKHYEKKASAKKRRPWPRRAT